MAASEQEAAVKTLVDAKADVLKGVHKLAYSFADSIVQSAAPLTMRPQQQALCGVCHALCKHGMPHEDIVARYVRCARSSSAGADAEGEAALRDALQVWQHRIAL